MLITLLEPMLNRVAQRYESDALTRRDLEQDMLVAIWLSLRAYEKQASLRTWAYDVAHDVGAQHMARHRLWRRNERLGHDLESVPNRHDTEAIITVHERALLLHALLGKLRPRERQAVLLDLQEFDAAEMSVAMQISKAQVRDTLVRARCRLTKWLRRHETRPPAASNASPRGQPFQRFIGNAPAATLAQFVASPVFKRTEMGDQWPRKI